MQFNRSSKRNQKANVRLLDFELNRCWRYILIWFVTMLVSSVSGRTVCAQNQTSGQLSAMRKINPTLPDPIQIDEQKMDALGIRVLTGKHIRLYTDIRNRDDIDELTSVFDQAVSQWCDYFGVDPEQTQNWLMRAFVIGDKERFIRGGVMNSLPNFPAGFQRGHEMWVYLQPGTYYTRHLLIHEGTHAFMQWFLRGTGAPWYTEGMAELLGVHSWKDGQLKINFQLTDRRQAEYWGRIKIIQEDRESGKSMSIKEVFDIPNQSFRQVRYYAWSWAACQFFSQHELTSKKFDRLKKLTHLQPAVFNARFSQSISTIRKQLDLDWQLFVSEIDFGYDLNRGRLQTLTASKPDTWTLQTDRSWQMTDLRIDQGEWFKIDAKGRFVVAIENGQPWPCESNGITIDYYRNRPLGQLLSGIADESDIQNLLVPDAVQQGSWIKADRSGFLCLRINESPAKFSDNNGELEIEVKLKSEP